MNMVASRLTKSTTFSASAPSANSFTVQISLVIAAMTTNYNWEIMILSKMVITKMTFKTSISQESMMLIELLFH